MKFTVKDLAKEKIELLREQGLMLLTQFSCNSICHLRCICLAEKAEQSHFIALIDTSCSGPAVISFQPVPGKSRVRTRLVILCI